MIRLALADYDPQWARRFEEHRERLSRALGQRARRIEHIGSTSVPGLAAKPIVDILVCGVQPGDEGARAALESAGYQLAVDEPGHRMYEPANRDAHIHVWSDESDADRHVLFRDWLRGHPQDRALYEHVKRQLTMREWPTSNDYAQAKDGVVATIMRRARGDSSNERIDYFASLLLEHLPPNARVLEIGAGEGLLAQRLAEEGHDVVALDTQLRSFYPVTEISFQAYDAGNARFDCVAAQLVLHHLDDLDATLTKVERLLQPRGIVAIDDYGWERSGDTAYREQRRDLHTSELMLSALREHFEQTLYREHAYVRGAEGDGPLGFTFLGTVRKP